MICAASIAIANCRLSRLPWRMIEGCCDCASTSTRTTSTSWAPVTDGAGDSARSRATALPAMARLKSSGAISRKRMRGLLGMAWRTRYKVSPARVGAETHAQDRADRQQRRQDGPHDRVAEVV